MTILGTRKLLYKAGYVIKVTSWENDADNYKTEEMWMEKREAAKALVTFFKLFTSKNSRIIKGIGNITRDNEWEKAKETILEMLEANPTFFDDIHHDFIDWDVPTDDEGKIEFLMEIAYDIGLGASEYYYTRVLDKLEVLHFTDDVYALDMTQDI